MPRDLPDWGALSAQTTVYEVTDLGELAVRLGSIVTFDRRGDVFWLEDFENGITKWLENYAGTGSAVADSTARSRNGGHSVKLTAGSDGLRYSEIQHRQALPSVSRLGFEFSFNFVTAVDMLRLRMSVYDGTEETSYRIRWRDTEDDLQYYDSDGNWQTFATALTLAGLGTLFHSFKLVVNQDTQEYVRFILGGTEYDISGIGAKVSSGGGGPHIHAYIRNTGRAASNDAVYIDDVIMTQNEPANA